MRRVPKSLTSFVFVAALFLNSQVAHAQDPTICESQGFPRFCTILITPSAFEFGSLEWADFDADGRQDIVLSGLDVTQELAEEELQVWLNLGDFILITPPPDPTKPPIIDYETRYRETTATQNFDRDRNLWAGATLATDLDSDGLVDVAVTGRNFLGQLTTLILNNTFGGESEFAVFQDNLDGIVYGDMAAADFDNDGDADIVMAGEDVEENSVFYYLRNDLSTAGSFSQSALPQLGLSIGSIDVGDFDGDQDFDVLATGITNSNDSVTKIYRNDGGTLVDSGIQLPGLLFSRARFVDVDDDGDLDIALSGARLTPFVLASDGMILQNNGGVFTQSVTFPGRYYGGFAAADIDLDGTSDLIPGGGVQLEELTSTLILANSGGGTSFTQSDRFGGGLFGDVEVGDYDGDGDLDVMMFGKLDTGGNRFLVYRNEIGGQNTLPNPPDGLQSNVSGPTVALSWNAATDAETPTPSLTYNVRVGTESGTNDVMPSNSTVDGRRLVSSRGNVDHNASWHLDGLAPGTYFWSVQTIDGSFAGSAFSAEMTFVVP